MTRLAIKRAFQKLDAEEQADILRELTEVLADAISDEDRADATVYALRRHEEYEAKPWSGSWEPLRTGRARRRAAKP